MRRSTACGIAVAFALAFGTLSVLGLADRPISIFLIVPVFLVGGVAGTFVARHLERRVGGPAPGQVPPPFE